MRNPEKDEREMTARRETMLKEGFRLFAAKGIDAVPMVDVARASHLGVATVYRYFKTKLSLVIAIGARQWEDYTRFIEQMRSAQHVDEKTAAEELDLYLQAYIELFRSHKDLLRFNQDFNNYIKKEGATTEQLRPYIEAIDRFARMFHIMYEKGKQDGTIRTDLSEPKMFAATSHIMVAVAVRYAYGLVYAPGDEDDLTEEYTLLKNMILREFVLVPPKGKEATET